MILQIRVLGCEFLHIELTESADEPDTTRDLSGGNLGSEAVEVGRTDVTMGFANGREE